MSTSWKVILKRLGIVAVVVLVLFGVVELFAYDVIKIQFVSFMAISPAMQPMENPLPVPAQSIPIEGPAYIPNMGAPKNPVPADQVSIARGAELFHINCTACHGEDAKGDGPVAPFLQKQKPADLTSPTVQFLSDGAIFMVISNGFGMMPPLNENLTVRERWDVVNYLRTLTNSSSTAATPTATPSTSPSPTPTVSGASATATSSSQTEPEPTEEVARPSNPGGPGDAINLTGDPNSGAQIFANNCQTCHNAQGKGGIPNPGSSDGTFPSLNPIDPTIKNSDLKTFAYNLDLFIQHGSTPESLPGAAPTSMPAWGDKNALTQQQIADVIAYIISLNP